MQIFRSLEDMKYVQEKITNHEDAMKIIQSKAMDTLLKLATSTFYNYLLSPHSIQVFCKPIQINLSLRGVLLYLSILSICIVSTTSSIATVPILSFKYSTEVFPCVSHCNVKRCPTIHVNSTCLYYILHSLTMILFFTRISSQRSGNSGYSDSSDSVPSYYKGRVIVLAVLTWTNDPYPYVSWISGLAQPAVSNIQIDTMSVLSKPFGDSIHILDIFMTDNNQQSQYNHCLLTSSFPSSDKLFLLMMDTMVFLSNPLVTTILHCKSLKPTLLLLLLCISMFVGPALCIQTTFMDKVFVIHLIIVPHPWKYLISIFFFFILGAAALFTTNCKNYMSSAKYYF